MKGVLRFSLVALAAVALGACSDDTGSGRRGRPADRTAPRAPSDTPSTAPDDARSPGGTPRPAPDTGAPGGASRDSGGAGSR